MSGTPDEDLSRQQARQPEQDQDARQGMTTGLGVDVVDIARMAAVLERSPGFAAHAFSADERAYCDGHAKPAVHYATHFAAKEAVLKALGTGFSGGIGPRDVEVVHDEKGRPGAVLHARAADVARELGVVEVALSLSRTHETAVANAIAITRDSAPAPREHADPQAELLARFKELRGMLDELESDIAEGSEQDSAGVEGQERLL